MDEEIGDTSRLEKAEEDSFVDIDNTPGIRSGYEGEVRGLVWWERRLRQLQGQGGGRGVLCTVNDAPGVVE